MTVGRWTIPVLAVVALVLYLVDPNNDFVGSADLYHAKHTATFAAGFDWHAADLSLPVAVGKLLQTAYALFFYPHGPLPPFYFGLVYKAYDLLGVPVTPALMQAPGAVMAAATVAMLAVLLRGAGLRWVAVISGALVVGLSPIFVAAARGLGTYWVVAIPFNQVMALTAFAWFRSGRRGGGWVLGLALAHVILADVLSFLVIGALLLADGLRGLDWKVRDLLPRAWWSWQHESSTLLVRPVMVPVLLAVAIPVVGLAAFLAFRNSIGLPLYPILPFWAFFAHGNQLGEPNNLNVMLTRLVLLAGDAFPLLLGLMAFGLTTVTRANRSDLRRLQLFSIVGLAGFFLLFYVLTANHPANLYYYQQYLLVSLAIAVALALERLLQISRFHLAAGCACFGAVVLGQASGISALVWKQTLSPFSSRLVVDEAWDPAGDSIGIRRPDYGHRAAGYLVRTLLLDAWSRQIAPVDVHFSSVVAWKYFEPFTVYAGLYQRGDWFTEKLGRRPAFSLSMLARSKGWSAFECDGGASYCVATLDPMTDRWTSVGLDEGALLPSCGAQYCVTLKFGQGGTAQEWWIIDDKAGGVTRYHIRVEGMDQPALAPGSYDRSDLEARFTQKWPKLWDYMPKRSNERLAAMVEGLLGR